MLGVAPTQVQDLACGPSEFHEVHTGPPLKPVKVHLGDMSSLQYVNCTTHLCAICKLRMHSIPLSISPTDMLDRTGPYTDCWEKLLSTDLYLDIKPLTTTLRVQPSRQFLIHWVVHPSNPCLFDLETRVLCRSVKCFAQVQVGADSCFSLIH